MQVHWLQHAEVETLGCIAPWLARREARVGRSRLYLGEPLPMRPAFDWLIVMGGPMNIHEHERHPWLVEEKRLIRAALDAGRTVLGICLGAQLLADQLGAVVCRNEHTEIGWYPLRLTAEGRAHPWLVDFPEEFEGFHWHGDRFALPPGAVQLASSAACSQQAYVWDGRALGLQFHPEVTQADIRRWAALWPTQPGPWVQSADEMLRQRERYAAANRLLLGLLERMADP